MALRATLDCDLPRHMIAAIGRMAGLAAVHQQQPGVKLQQAGAG
jgi:hypothetical protein